MQRLNSRRAGDFFGHGRPFVAKAVSQRQVIQRLHAVDLQELSSRLVQKRPAERIVFAGNANEFSLHQLLEHLGRLHAAHRFDVGAGQRLPVRDDRQSFQHRRSQLERRLPLMQLVEPEDKFAPRQQTQASRNTLDSEGRPTGIVGPIQSVDQSSSLIRIRQRCELHEPLDRQRFVGDEQDCFQPSHLRRAPTDIRGIIFENIVLAA